MRILITGGAGFIGSHLVEHHLRAGHTVAVLDDMSRGRRENLAGMLDRVPFFRVDICDRAGLTAAFSAFRPDVVSHHAAQMSVSASSQDPVADARTNVLGLLHVLQASVAQGVRKLIFASSGGTVYGDCPLIPTPEDAPLAPLSPYGISKLAGEQYVRYFQRACGIDFTILRYANVYGPRQAADGEAGVVAIFIEKLLAGEAPVIHWDGEQRKDYIHVEDVARAHLQAIAEGSGGTYNIGSGQTTTVNALYQAIEHQLGTGLSPGRGPRRAGDVRISRLAIERARHALDWRPQVPLEAGLIDTVAYFRARHELPQAA
ncbi:MAG: NAD-dependent epimerase/dehydratase family protein [Candidatus Sericytochromatia bacterium]|nr:NAD-dependent epimerase/dehydratase family protein [Candidatus Sericytochromatia bacterium]